MVMGFDHVREGDTVEYRDEAGQLFEARVDWVGIAHFRADGISFGRGPGKAMIRDAQVIRVVEQ